jgi:RNA polymerase sigma-70 factor (ECF subfamily)
MNNFLRDKALVKALQKGDVKAFNELYYKYHKKIFAFSLKFLKNKADAEDLIQKIFVIIWEKKENLNPEKSFNNYLFIIARNEIYDLLKKKALTEYYNDQILSDTEQEEEDIETKKLVEVMYSLIEKMPERRRQIFLMNRDMGLTYKQIAKKLGITENTVDTQIRNSLNYLRKELPKYIKSSHLLLIGFIIILL